MKEPEIVWLFEQRTFGILKFMGAYFSTVLYKDKDGIETIDIVGNDEWEFYERHVHKYEQD